MIKIRKQKLIAIFLLIPLFSYLIITPAIARDFPPWDKGHDGTRATPDDGTPPETPCKPPCKDDDCSKGSPVYLKDGNFLYSAEDLMIPGRMPFQIVRSYNSNDNLRSGLFGYGWTFTYCYRIIETEDAETETITATLLVPNGQRYDFTLDNGTYIAPPRVYDTLTKTDGVFSLRKKSGTIFRFDDSGNLISIADRNGNALTFTNESGVISTITDDAGRQLSFQYGSEGKISSITDPASRIFSYTYDDKGNLETYTNSVEGKTVYEYDDEHNLKSITDPRDNKVIDVVYDSSGRVSDYTDRKRGNLDICLCFFH
ncbi:MAG: RHS repeat protein [Desulfobacteraceae bacterium]|nr:RHS repeat protein [Desulfobacteraceae bacterium]